MRGVDAQGARDAAGRVRDLRELLGGGIDVDRRVGAEDDVLLEDEHVHAAHDLGLGMRADHLERGPDRLGVVHVHAGEQRVGVAAGDHARAEIVAVEELAARFAERRVPFAGGAARDSAAYSSRFADVAGSSIAMSSSGMSMLRGDALDRRRDCRAGSASAMPSSTMMRAARMIFGSSPSGNTMRLGSRTARLMMPAHDPARAPEPRLELLAIVLEVDELLRDAARDGGPRDRRRDPEQHARIEREGNEVVGAELHRAQSVEARHAVRHVLLGERGERARRRHLHLLVDLGRAHVERAAEDEREAEDVVDLVRDSRCGRWR